MDFLSNWMASNSPTSRPRSKFKKPNEKIQRIQRSNSPRKSNIWVVELQMRP